jgi:hypothetical protein
MTQTLTPSQVQILQQADAAAEAERRAGGFVIQYLQHPSNFNNPINRKGCRGRNARRTSLYKAWSGLRMFRMIWTCKILLKTTMFCMGALPWT